MILDAELGGFCGEGQAISGTVAVVSTNVFDATVAKKLFGGSPGQAPKVACSVSAVGGTNPTILAQLVGDSVAALNSTPIVIASYGPTRVLTAADIPYVFDLWPGEQLDPKRFYGVIFTMTGTAPTATVTADVAIDSQTAGLKLGA